MMPQLNKKYRYLYLGLLLCTLPQVIWAADVSKPELTVNLTANYDYKLHAPVPATASERLINSSTQTYTQDTVINLQTDSLPSEWSNYSSFKRYDMTFTPFGTSSDNIDITLPSTTLSGNLSSAFNGSDTTYKIYPTGIDGVGIIYRFAMKIRNGGGINQDNRGVAQYNSGKNGKVYPKIFNFARSYSDQVSIGIQAQLVKVQRKSFEYSTPTPVNRSITLGQFEIHAHKFAWFDNAGAELPSKIIIPVKVNLNLTLQPKTCTITSSEDQTVTLAPATATLLNDTPNSPSVPTATANFTLADCDPSITVYSAVTDANNTSNTNSVLSNTASSNNVGIALFKGSAPSDFSSPIAFAPNDATYGKPAGSMPDPYASATIWTWDTNGNGTYSITGRYQKIDNSQPATGGAVESKATVHFFYQ